jgi:glycerol-3-phosphate cytidylyltransferase
MEMLRALSCVDIVRPYYELEYVTGCKALNADIFVVGEDWGTKPHNIAVESYLKTAGKQIKQVLYDPRTSSTRIKQTVNDQTSNLINAQLESRGAKAWPLHPLNSRPA